MHNLAHPGIKSAVRLLSTKFFWPGMKEDLRKWCRSCSECQRVKVTRRTRVPLHAFPQSNRFEHVHIDLIVLENSKGFRYLCTFVDRATHWIEAIPLKDISAETISKVFYEQWVSRYGIPLQITSERGPQFTSNMFSELCMLIGSDHIKTTAYNPKANGALEQTHRRLKEALKAYGRNWIHSLPTVLLGLRAAPRDHSGHLCAELTFSTTLKLPGEFYTKSEDITNTTSFVRQLRDTIGKFHPVPFLHKTNRSVFVHRDLQVGDKVWVRVDRVRQPLEAPYDGPFHVIKGRPKYFTLQMGDKVDDVRIDRLKPVYELKGEEDLRGTEVNVPKSVLKNVVKG